MAPCNIFSCTKLMTKSLPQGAWGLKPKNGTKYKYAENTEFRENFQRNSFIGIFLQFETKDKVTVHIKLTFRFFKLQGDHVQEIKRSLTILFSQLIWIVCVIFKHILVYLKYHDFLTFLLLWNQCIKNWVLYPFILYTFLQSALSLHICNTFF